MHPEFVRQFTKFDQAIAASWQIYSGACLVIGGELDFSGRNVKNFNRIAPCVESLRQEFLIQTDHVFNVLDNTNNKAAWVIETVIGWFEKTL